MQEKTPHACPFCQGLLKAPAYGQTVTCPHCGSHFRTQVTVKAALIIGAIALALGLLVVIVVALL